MNAYVIMEVKIKDQDVYKRECRPVFDATHKEYGGRRLARTDEPAPLPGCLRVVGWFWWNFPIQTLRGDGGTVQPCGRPLIAVMSCGSTVWWFWRV